MFKNAKTFMGKKLEREENEDYLGVNLETKPKLDTKDKTIVDTIKEQFEGINKKYRLEKVGMVTFDTKLGPVLTDFFPNNLGINNPSRINELLIHGNEFKMLTDEKGIIINYPIQVKNPNARGGSDYYTLVVMLENGKINYNNTKELIKNAAEDYKKVIKEFYKSKKGGMNV